MNSRFFSHRFLTIITVVIGCSLSAVTFALPPGATCTEQNCDPGLICADGSGSPIPDKGTGTCKENCDNDGSCESGETEQYCGRDCGSGGGTTFSNPGGTTAGTTTASNPGSGTVITPGNPRYCAISGPEVCAGGTYTFTCNALSNTSGITMSATNPTQTSVTNSITLNYQAYADGVTSILCSIDGNVACATSKPVGFCGDEITNCNEECDYGDSFPDACNTTTCTWESCTQASDCGNTGLFVCTDGQCAVSTCGDGIVSSNEQCESISDCASSGPGYTCDSCACVPTEDGKGVCGNLIVEEGEKCDDGKNGNDVDGCTDLCQLSFCDSQTTYAPGDVPGYACPDGWVLQGCPGMYACSKITVAPILCTECGNGNKDTSEECDRSDPNDPFHEGCNQYCTLNYCGDGEISSGTAEVTTGIVWNWDPVGATQTRSPLLFLRSITASQGNPTFNAPSGNDKFGRDMTLLNDFDHDGFEELAVSAPGSAVSSVANHGQIVSLSFDSSGQLDATVPYFTTAIGPNIELGKKLTSIGDMDAHIFTAYPVSALGKREFVYSMQSDHPVLSKQLHALFVGMYQAYIPNTNTGTITYNPVASSASQRDTIRALANIGDLDNNHIDDVAVVYQRTTNTVNDPVFVIELLQGNKELHQSTANITSIILSGTMVDKIISIGDSDGDGVEDMLISLRPSDVPNTNTVNILFALQRILLNTDGSVKSVLPVYSEILPRFTAETNILWGQDVDEDGVKDMIIERNKNENGTLTSSGTLFLMNANRSIKQKIALDFDALVNQDYQSFQPFSSSFLPDFDADGDETIIFGSPNIGGGILHMFELQAPYGHEGITSGVVAEECDTGSYCNDLVTRCEQDPSICPGGPTECQPRYINGCTPLCQIGCGDGTVDADGVDDILGNDDDELCDDANGSDYDSCTNSCKRPSCGDGILTDEAYWLDENNLPVTYAEMCDPLIDPACPVTCQLTGGVNARCNYTFASAGAYGLDGANIEELKDAGSLCYPIGVPIQTGAPTTNASGVVTAWNWTCAGLNGGASASCTLPRRSCGDGIVDVWTNASGHAVEECDDGNTISNDGCSATCAWETPLQMAEAGQCTPGTYPQIEDDEYLPIWWIGSRSNSVGTPQESCEPGQTNRNVIIRNTIKCLTAIQRGAAEGSGMERVNQTLLDCGMHVTTQASGAKLISDAVAHFTDYEYNQTLGSYIFTPMQVNNWVNYNQQPRYGQYQISVDALQMNYCAYRRTSSAGTATGITNSDPSGFEICDNNFDDNGDGFVDCTDPRCTGADTCQNTCTGNECYEICGNGSDDDGNGKTDCADPQCTGDQTCRPGFNENCFNGHDDNGDGRIDAQDPTCYWLYGTGHQPPPAIGPRTLSGVVYLPEDGEPICEEGFSVSKGYFVQQGFAFSEQPNTGIDTATFSNISGMPLVAEGTAIDDSLNAIARYQGAGKQYLFNDFINNRQIKAVNKITFTLNGIEYKLLKVPSAQIYFWDGDQNGELILNRNVIQSMLARGGIDYAATPQTPFTVVAPDLTQKITIAGSMNGNGMFISQGNIKFDPVSCDSTDVVEGLFIAGGSFETETIGNSSLNASEWCRGGNLQIKGTLLGMNAGSSLAPQRRSVLDSWTGPAQYLFDSAVTQAKDLFETCYLPNLLKKKLGFSGAPNSPVAQCYINPDGTLSASAKSKGNQAKNDVKTVLTISFLTNALSVSKDSEIVGSQPSAAGKLAKMLIDGMPINTTPPNDNGTNELPQIPGIPTVGNGFKSVMLAAGKTRPDWLLDGYTETDKENLYRLLAKSMDPIKSKFVGFTKPLVTNTTNYAIDYDPGKSIYGALTQIFTPSGLNGLQNNLNNIITEACSGNIPIAGYKGYILFKALAECKMSYYPDFKWLVDNREVGQNQGAARQEQVIEGSSITISSQPKLWTNLPPGAKDFLNSLIVLPQ